MTNKKNQQISIGGAIVFKDSRGKKYFLLVKTKEGGDWEIPKITVRRGESSVRSVIRMTSEQGGISTKVLEEVGRYTSSAVINGKSVSQKHYYYLMIQKGGPSEMIGFYSFKWFASKDIMKKLTSKKEKEMFKMSRGVLKEWEAKHKAQII